MITLYYLVKILMDWFLSFNFIDIIRFEIIVSNL